jgi:hypothetical protein
MGLSLYPSRRAAASLSGLCNSTHWGEGHDRFRSLSLHHAASPRGTKFLMLPPGKVLNRLVLAVKPVIDGPHVLRATSAARAIRTS